MKKRYIKPDLTFESFEMSSNIAADCTNRVISGIEKCGNMIVPGMSLFAEHYNCEYVPEDAGLCYQSVSGENVIFTS